MRRCFCLAMLLIVGSSGIHGADALTLSDLERQRCIEILRGGLQSDEFWPAMHAAEALTVSGHGDEVIRKLTPMLPIEKDDQRRCGLARELVRAGDLARTQVLLDVLASDDPYGHTHAAESLFKVRQQGDGKLLRAALRSDSPAKKRIMAAAALARTQDEESFKVLRGYVHDQDGPTASVAAWVLARVGNATDIPALRAGEKRFDDPLVRAYFQHALAALGDEHGLAALIQNLKHDETAVRVYACEFAPEAKAVEAKPALLRLLDDEVLDIRIRAAQAFLQLAAPAAKVQ